MDRKICKIEPVATACYSNCSKSFGIGYLNDIPVLFTPITGFNPTVQPACRNGRTCFTNVASVTCYDGLVFFINDSLWRVRNGCWIIDEGGK